MHRHLGCFLGCGRLRTSLSWPLLCLQVNCAITRQKKEEIVTNLKQKLDSSAIVFGMRFKGLSVGVLHLASSAGIVTTIASPSLHSACCTEREGRMWLGWLPEPEPVPMPTCRWLPCKSSARACLRQPACSSARTTVSGPALMSQYADVCSHLLLKLNCQHASVCVCMQW